MPFFKNARIEILTDRTLSKGWSHLRELTVRYTRSDGRAEILKREIYERGAAAAILLYDPSRKSVILVRQLRLPAYLAGENGFLLEVPAGMLDNDNPADAIRREAMEETGYALDEVVPLFKAYMSPGAITEFVHFFFARIDAGARSGKGGGLEEEAEDIEVVEIKLSDALAMIASGDIRDGKTIMLLYWAAANGEICRSG